MNIKSAKQKFGRPPPGDRQGMTLVEVVVALALAGLAMGSIVSGYIFCTSSAEKSALSLAANARAMARLEETRSATWTTAVDQLVATNFPAQVLTLDLSGSGSGITYATNLTVISQISTNPPLKRIRVDCIWSFKGDRLLTNTIETCRAPDQ